MRCLFVQRECLAVLCAVVAVAVAGELPNIVVVVGDDVGWANVGWHNPSPSSSNASQWYVRTPRMDALVADGIELDRHYAFKSCGPSRSALHSGRWPVHVESENSSPEQHNAADPVAGFAGIPRNMTGVAERLREAGYRTAVVGKVRRSVVVRDWCDRRSIQSSWRTPSESRGKGKRGDETHGERRDVNARAVGCTMPRLA